MDKNDIPESFGVFKPVGHTVIAWRSAAELQDAAAALREQGFTGEALVRYTPAEMLAQTAEDLANASPLASLGQDLNLVKQHRELAQAGCSFLVVHAPGADQQALVDAVLNGSNAVSAQRYGRMIVEELVQPAGAGTSQVFESPDRGLNPEAAADTPPKMAPQTLRA